MTAGRLGGSRGVWVLSLLLIGLAVAVFATVAPGLAPVDVDHRVPWFALAAGLAACEAWALHLYFRGSAHAFSLTALVLTVGLVLATPVDLLLAQAGPIAVLAWRRGPLQLAFGTGRSALVAAVALVVFHAVLPGTEATGPGVWFAALMATLAAGATGVLVLAGAITVAEGRPLWREIGTMLRTDAMVTVSLTCVGLAATTLVVLDAASAWLLVFPALLLAAAYRLYLDERQRRERLEFLYDTSHALLVSADVEEALLALVGKGRRAFNSELAEAILLPAGGALPRRTRVSPIGTDSLASVGPLGGEALWAMARELGTRLIERPAADPAVERYLRDSLVRGPAMVTVLEKEGHALGLLLFANRPEVDGEFTDADLDVLDKLARHATASLAHETLEQDFDRLEQLQSQLEHMAFHDPLTRLANRARFTAQVSHALTRRDALVAALFIDLDDFKTVNDSLGHEAGDELLMGVAERLRACLRSHDTPARLGGDEFAVLIEDGESMEVVMDIAERILAALRDPFQVADAELNVRASIGVASSSDGVRRADDLVRNADLAMYRAKSQGKGCVMLFRPEMHSDAVQRHELKSELQRAVDEDQFVVLYQPVVDLRGGQIAGVEALVRWQHPRLGLVGPDKFVPLAEEANLIGAIGRHVVAKSSQRLALWRRASVAGDAFKLNINLSPREFQSPGLLQWLCEAAARANVPTSAITLEITESALMDDLEGGIQRMKHIKQAGFRLALDDFGTGYSSLSYLRQFPIDVLKIAKPFVDHIAEREGDAAFLRSILELAKTLSLDVIVEGVETTEQARMLLEMGARQVQGFVFSRPVEDRALSAMLTLTPLQGFAQAQPIEQFSGVAEISAAPVPAPAR
ncbi:MAG TPA: EAL domain-containing protein [Solirubrobacteraceae bacterium]